MKVHKLNYILFIILMFIHVTHCKPGRSKSRSAPKSMMKVQGGGSGAANTNLEEDCTAKLAEGKRQALRKGFQMDTQEFNAAARDYLETNGCTGSQVYKNFLASTGLPQGPAALAAAADPNTSSGSTYGLGSGSGGGDGYSGGGDSFSGGGNSGDSNSGDGDSAGEGGSNLDPTLTYYFDVDLDGFGSDDPLDVYTFLPTTAYSTNNLDCDDNNAQINPDIDEDCKDGLDNDCDGETDEMKYFTDKDQDTYGTDLETTATVWTACLYSPSANIDLLTTNSVSQNNDDCNDGDAAVHLTTAWYIDEDDDGWGKKGSNPSNQCSGSSETSIELQGSQYVKNPNDCLDELDDDGEKQDTTSNIDNDPDCDGLYDGSSKGSDCDDTVFNQYSQENDLDCDGREDFEGDTNQLDWCIKYDDNEDTDYSTTKPSLSLAVLKGSDYKNKRELHKCGNDYDMDGCWNWSEECNDPNNYSVTESDNEDCDDGTSESAGGSLAGTSEYLYTRYLQFDDDNNDVCDTLEFKNTGTTSGETYRVQVRKDETWYDICAINDDNNDNVTDIWIDDDSMFHCQSNSEHNYYFQIYSRDVSDHSWAINDKITLKMKKDLTLQGAKAGANYDNYVVTCGTNSIMAERYTTGASCNTDDRDSAHGQYISAFEDDSSEIAWDPAGYLWDSSRVRYPIVSNAFKLHSSHYSSDMQWAHSAWSLVHDMDSSLQVYVRFIKALCIPEKTLAEMLENPSVLKPKRETCSHNKNKER